MIFLLNIRTNIQNFFQIFKYQTAEQFRFFCKRSTIITNENQKYSYPMHGIPLSMPSADAQSFKEGLKKHRRQNRQTNRKDGSVCQETNNQQQDFRQGQSSSETVEFPFRKRTFRL